MKRQSRKRKADNVADTKVRGLLGQDGGVACLRCHHVNDGLKEKRETTLQNLEILLQNANVKDAQEKLQSSTEKPATARRRRPSSSATAVTNHDLSDQLKSRLHQPRRSTRRTEGANKYNDLYKNQYYKQLLPEMTEKNFTVMLPADHT